MMTTEHDDDDEKQKNKTTKKFMGSPTVARRREQAKQSSLPNNPNIQEQDAPPPSLTNSTASKSRGGLATTHETLQAKQQVFLPATVPRGRSTSTASSASNNKTPKGLGSNTTSKSASKQPRRSAVPPLDINGEAEDPFQDEGLANYVDPLVWDEGPRPPSAPIRQPSVELVQARAIPDNKYEDDNELARSQSTRQQAPSLPRAQQVDPIRDRERKKIQQQKERQCLWIGFAITAICVVVITISVPVALVTRNNNSNNNNNQSPSPQTIAFPEPTMASSSSLTESQYTIDNLPNYTLEAMAITGTPQQEAYEWVFSHPDFRTMPNWRKQQLLALATFYFAMNGQTWPTTIMDWMDYGKHECYWTINTEELLGGTGAMPPDWQFCFCFCSSIAIAPGPDNWISNCNDNDRFEDFTIPFDSRLVLNGTLPKELGLLTSLTNLAVKYNHIRGELPSEVVANLPILTKLDLASCDLTGALPTEIGLLSALTHLDISHNYFSGSLPVEIANLKQLIWLDAQNNSFYSTLPTELGIMNNLYYLLLSYNNFTGAVPSEIGRLPNMSFVDLSNNALSAVPPTLFHIPHVSLHSNLISEIPTNVTSTGREHVLDLGNNLISSIPSELFRLTSLARLNLERNQIATIPSEITQMTNLLQCQDNGFMLSNNLLNEIPTPLAALSALYEWTFDNNFIAAFPDIAWNTLVGLHNIKLSGNHLNTPIPTELGLLQNLEFLDLSSNDLIGPIPVQLGTLDDIVECSDSHEPGYDNDGYANCSHFRFLNLSHNSLTGQLPSTLGLLTALSFIDLSSNMLSGPVPKELWKLSANLGNVNLKGNNFTGDLPEEVCPWFCKNQFCSDGTYDETTCQFGILQVDCAAAGGGGLDCSVCSCDATSPPTFAGMASELETFEPTFAPSSVISEASLPTSPPMPSASLQNSNIQQFVNLWSRDPQGTVKKIGPISDWDTSNITSMKNLFAFDSVLNENISRWNVSSVTDFTNMFWEATAWDGYLGDWDVSKATSMRCMFCGAQRFRGRGLEKWNNSLGNVQDMSNMFQDTMLEANLSNWQVGSVTNFREMFSNVPNFNDVLCWNVKAGTIVNNMFLGTDGCLDRQCTSPSVLEEVECSSL